MRSRRVRGGIERRTTILGSAALLAVATLRPARSPAVAQPLPPAVAAVVDHQRILRESKAAKSIQQQLEVRRKLYLDQLAKEEQRLNEVGKELARQRGVLSAEAFAQKRKEYEEAVQALQRASNERRRQLDEALAAANNVVRQALKEIVDELAESRGFNLVLPASGVLLYSPKIDITDEVLARLDRKLPTVKVPEIASNE
ncbi:MAG: OmpH family outer membrane protein [Geminicoccaceae bacterium]|nr:OmpH family outer membrane protein [Geminicoccaceae bacterium]MCS7268322.1 OmpH family outer membrane protein [Geminicoccaceae bacterium]MCX7629208.1 OmpH family outer membrane protein [Geminicoccaceae bacterium]MDW8124627.1 OmpH family outer membrane protein [Geminicoccaceae bacterium]MDW8341313.1 OmpH family outer membrane protein [Geminicoccaceae bacterium]